MMVAMSHAMDDAEAMEGPGNEAGRMSCPVRDSQHGCLMHGASEARQDDVPVTCGCMQVGMPVESVMQAFH